jgi:hypothetical protein
VAGARDPNAEGGPDDTQRRAGAAGGSAGTMALMTSHVFCFT